MISWNIIQPPVQLPTVELLKHSFKYVVTFSWDERQLLLVLLTLWVQEPSTGRVYKTLLSQDLESLPKVNDHWLGFGKDDAVLALRWAFDRGGQETGRGPSAALSGLISKGTCLAVSP